MSMKIVRFNCCGMDVHKNLIVATIGITDKETSITQYFQKQFSTLNPDLVHLKDWLKEHDCHDACMESTGKYWIPIFNVLEDEISIYLTHPKYVKAIKGKKTDKKNSKWICDLFIGLASVLSDPFGKTATKIMNEIMTSEIIDDEKIKSLIHGKCKNKDKILDSLNGFKIESDQRFKISQASKHMEYLDQMIEVCEIEMVKRAYPMKDSFQHITQILGISTISFIIIISEIDVDMGQFETDKQLISWAGLSPANNESANKKKKSVRISKADQYLKPLLIQCALTAIKIKDSYFGTKYNRIKKCRGHKKAIIAIARMMLVCIYHMIQTGEDFNPSDYESLMNPNPKKESKFTVESALQFLQQSGLDISSIQATL